MGNLGLKGLAEGVTAQRITLKTDEWAFACVNFLEGEDFVPLKNEVKEIKLKQTMVLT